MPSRGRFPEACEQASYRQAQGHTPFKSAWSPLKPLETTGRTGGRGPACPVLWGEGRKDGSSSPRVANFPSYDETHGSMTTVSIFLVWSWGGDIATLSGEECNAEVDHARTTGAGAPVGEGP